MLIAMPFTMASSISLVVLRLQRRIRAFNILMAANLVIAAFFGVSSILMFNIAAAGVLIGFISGNAAAAIAGIWIIRADIASPMLRSELKKLLDVGFPLVLSGSAMWLIGFVNRPILVRHISADDIGLYAIATGAVGMFALLVAAFRNAWQPFAFSIMGHEEYPSIYAQALTLFTALGAIAAVGLALFAPQVLLLINLYTHKNWSGAAPAVGPLALGTILSAMYSVIQTGAFIARRTGVIVITVVIAALVNALLNLLLIPDWGMLGAALATALGHLTSLIIGYYFAQRLAPIPYHVGRLVITIAVATIAVAAGSGIQSGDVLHDLLLKLMILALYCGVLFVSRTVTGDDLLLFRNIRWAEHTSKPLLVNSQTNKKL
jgi:O-antigen/teichoic acid export membrane protein